MTRPRSASPAPTPVAPGWGLDFAAVFDCGPGHVAEVLGSTAKVTDVEKCIGVDHGALRFRPLIRAGWGREGVAWGPFEQQPGLAASVLVLNGHNASADEPLSEPLRARLRRWLDGPGGEPLLGRAIAHARHPRRNAWQLRNWLAHSGRFHRPSGVRESFSFGWSDAPDGTGGLRIQGSDGRNGALVVGPPGTRRVAVDELRNVPLLLVALDRGETTAFYAAALQATHNLPGLAAGIRPVGIVRNKRQSHAWASVQQAVLGQIGFRVDTRVYGVRTATVPGWTGWYGSAAFADRCTGAGSLGASRPAAGGSWRNLAGEVHRTPGGARAAAESAVALSDCEAAGLARAVIAPGSGSAGLVFETGNGGDGYVQVVTTRTGLAVTAVRGGVERTLGELRYAAESDVIDLQVVFEGPLARVSADGEAMECDLGGEPRGRAGITVAGDALLRDFEVHEATVALPADLAIATPAVPRGGRVLLRDDFDGHAGELAGRHTSAGAWARSLGAGVVRVADGAASVDATLNRPNPGRTAYTVPWSNPELADIEVAITPPGRARGEGHNGRAGLIFWQDRDNYIIVNNWLDDGYPGASISSFFRLGGYEDIYEAVWTNVASRVRWGEPHDLRVAFDGLRYMVSVDGEPVLYRALTDVRPEARRLAIRRVGIAANWEWGDDTGSSFRRFVARG
ncbi:MAG: hypothetical protein IT303_02130 [Dehalococcoidia bacterium]|nr:hypothetical protein [Dehalococcoidia bacterium]